jgi:hypothetical protein
VKGETGEWSGQPVLFTLPRNMVYPALLPLMRTPRADSSRLNWRPRRFKWTRPVSPKDEIWFPLVCHHISNAVYIKTQPRFDSPERNCDTSQMCSIACCLGYLRWSLRALDCNWLRRVETAMDRGLLLLKTVHGLNLQDMGFKILTCWLPGLNFHSASRDNPLVL